MRPVLMSLVLFVGCGHAEPPCVEQVVSESFVRRLPGTEDLVFVIDGTLGVSDHLDYAVHSYLGGVKPYDFRVVVMAAADAQPIGLPLRNGGATESVAVARARDAARKGGPNRVFDAAVNALTTIRSGAGRHLVVLAARDDESAADASAVVAA